MKNYINIYICRFGKHRKSIDNGLIGLENDKELDPVTRRQLQEEHDRMQEQYRRMTENSHHKNVILILLIKNLT